MICLATSPARSRCPYLRLINRKDETPPPKFYIHEVHIVCELVLIVIWVQSPSILVKFLALNKFAARESSSETEETVNVYTLCSCPAVELETMVSLEGEMKLLKLEREMYKSYSGVRARGIEARDFLIGHLEEMLQYERSRVSELRQEVECARAEIERLQVMFLWWSLLWWVLIGICLLFLESKGRRQARIGQTE